MEKEIKGLDNQRKNYFIEECVKWYKKNNGEVTTKECFKKAIELTSKEFDNLIKQLQEELRKRLPKFWDNMEGESYYQHLIIDRIFEDVIGGKSK